MIKSLIIDTKKSALMPDPDWSKALVKVVANGDVDGENLTGILPVQLLDLPEQVLASVNAGISHFSSIDARWLISNTTILRHLIVEPLLNEQPIPINAVDENGLNVEVMIEVGSVQKIDTDGKPLSSTYYQYSLHQVLIDLETRKKTASRIIIITQHSQPSLYIACESLYNWAASLTF